MNNELRISLISRICYAQCSIIIMEITAKIMIITEIRFPTNALTGHIISNSSFASSACLVDRGRQMKIEGDIRQWFCCRKLADRVLSSIFAAEKRHIFLYLPISSQHAKLVFLICQYRLFLILGTDYSNSFSLFSKTNDGHSFCKEQRF